MGDARTVILSANAQKDLRKVPRHVVDKILSWVLLVEAKGIRESRRIPGFHDEPLRGSRSGQRSIRLNKSYRAIYIEIENNSVVFLRVEEIHKHEY